MSLTASCLQNTTGYNLAALRYIKRQHDEAKTADVLEQVGMEDEEAIRAKIAEGLKKRKRAVV